MGSWQARSFLGRACFVLGWVNFRGVSVLSDGAEVLVLFGLIDETMDGGIRGSGLKHKDTKIARRHKGFVSMVPVGKNVNQRGCALE